MLTQERHLQILAQLEEKGTVSVAQLTQLLGASESTVRRDLIALDRLGKLHKVHGGATLTRRDFIRRHFYAAALSDRVCSACNMSAIRNRVCCQGC